MAKAEFNTIRLQLLKVAARVTETASRVRVAFASACPEAILFRHLAGAIRPAVPRGAGRQVPANPLRLSNAFISSSPRRGEKHATKNRDRAHAFAKPATKIQTLVSKGG